MNKEKQPTQYTYNKNNYNPNGSLQKFYEEKKRQAEKRETDTAVLALKETHEILESLINAVIFFINNNIIKNTKDEINEFDIGNSIPEGKKRYKILYFVGCIILDLIIIALMPILLIYVIVPLFVFAFFFSIGFKCLDKVIRYTITIVAIIIALKISLYIIDLDSDKIHNLYDSTKSLGIINFYKDSYSIVGLGNVFNTFVKSLKELVDAIF